MADSRDGMISFHVANKAAMHLGRKLYSTTPPALAELIANSYDAYASEVYVELQEGSPIVVADNGLGMDIDGLNRRYAIVGNTKVPDEAPCGFELRKPMGKKGIGKLASFSLGDEYEVFTRKSADQPWRSFVVNYREYIGEENRATYDVPSKLGDLPEHLSRYASFEHGFIVEIRGLRRNVTSQTTKATKNQLSRRFYIKSNADRFSLHLNGEPMDLSRNVYYGNLEYVCYFGFDRQGIQELIDPNDPDSVAFEGYDWERAQPSLMREVLESLAVELGVKGWIGTVSQPKQLKGDANNSNIIVYINGKIADEDVLKGEPNSMMANEYVVGEFFADYLGEGEEDPITSSRQGLDYDDDGVKKLVAAIAKIRSHVLEEWGRRREKDAIEKMPRWLAANNPYKEWVSGLSKSQKRLNSKLLKVVTMQIDRGEIEDERACALVNGIINVVTNADVYRIVDEMESIGSEDHERQLVYVAELLSKIAASEQLKQAQIVKERLAAIDRLEKLMADPSTIEKTFEDHLFENPWLINPYWNQSGKSTEQLRITRQRFHKLYEGMDGEYKKTFVDICVEAAEEPYPIVVELKRNTAKGYAKATPASIMEQIKKYRKAIIQELGLEGPGSNRPSVIKAYFILSEDTGRVGQGHAIEFDDDDRDLFDRNNIEIVPYSTLIKRARQAYQDHLKVLDEAKKVPFLHVGSREGANLPNAKS